MFYIAKILIFFDMLMVNIYSFQHLYVDSSILATRETDRMPYRQHGVNPPVKVCSA